MLALAQRTSATEGGATGRWGQGNVAAVSAGCAKRRRTSSSCQQGAGNIAAVSAGCRKRSSCVSRVRET
eukprot:359280-Chlamydomonas_euryale.AAC.4